MNIIILLCYIIHCLNARQVFHKVNIHTFCIQTTAARESNWLGRSRLQGRETGSEGRGCKGEKQVQKVEAARESNWLRRSNLEKIIKHHKSGTITD